MGVAVKVVDGGAETTLMLVTHQQPSARKTISKHHHAHVGVWALSWALHAPLIADDD